MGELKEDFLKIANDNSKRYKDAGNQIRESVGASNRKIVTRRKSSVKASTITFYALLILAGVLTVGYFDTKSQMQDKTIIDPKTGYTSEGNAINYPFNEVVDEMFKGKGN